MVFPEFRPGHARYPGYKVLGGKPIQVRIMISYSLGDQKNNNIMPPYFLISLWGVGQQGRRRRRALLGRRVQQVLLQFGL